MHEKSPLPPGEISRQFHGESSWNDPVGGTSGESAGRRRAAEAVAYDIIQFDTMEPSDYRVRLAGTEDVAGLQEIERQAASMFADHLAEVGLTEEDLDRAIPAEEFASAQRTSRLWVAESRSREVVGFALVIDFRPFAHLDELDVLPAHGRRGVGSLLLDTVCVWARESGYSAVTLRTFRDIPWNRPFYERRGFRVVEPSTLSEPHVQLVDGERERGRRTDLRAVMVYPLG